MKENILLCPYTVKLLICFLNFLPYSQVPYSIWECIASSSDTQCGDPSFSDYGASAA